MDLVILYVWNDQIIKSKFHGRLQKVSTLIVFWLGKCLWYCVITENIHTRRPPPHMDGQWKFLRGGGAKG